MELKNIRKLRKNESDFLCTKDLLNDRESSDMRPMRGRVYIFSEKITAICG